MGNRGITSILGLAIILVLMSLTSAAFASTHSIERVSTDSSGNAGDDDSQNASTSSDGRYVAFNSSASDLSPADSDSWHDVFLKDTETGAITLVSASVTGDSGNNSSVDPAVSANGRYVAFSSFATNLVESPAVVRLAGPDSHIYVKDTQTGEITRVSTNSLGVLGSGSSYDPAISADGRYVAFWSTATNLVDGDGNGFYDIFVKDTETGATTRVSTSFSGAEGNNNSQAPSISANGRYVAFHSIADNFVPPEVVKLIASGDTNGMQDVFVKDTETGALTRVSTSSSGAEGDNASQAPSISATGRYVAYSSWASNLVTGDVGGYYDIFVKDTETNETTLVSRHTSGAQGNDSSLDPSISSDGRYVSYSSFATNLADINLAFISPLPAVSTSHIFVTDTSTGTTDRLSESDSQVLGDGSSNESSISANGRFVHFESEAVNLVTPDVNSATDVFRTLNPTWIPPAVTIWPRANDLSFGLWSKLAGKVHDGNGDPIEGQKVWLQYKDGSTWKWLKNVYTDSSGYYQHWFYYEGGTRTYRAKEAQYDQASNSTQIALTNNISAWNTYRPTVKYCQWTKIHGKYGGPDGLNKNTTLYLQRKSGSSWVWQATVATDSTGYYAAWAMICPTTNLRMGTAGSAVTSSVVTKTGSTINAWQNSNVHAVLKDGFGAGVSGISLYLQKWNGSAWTWQATCSTSSTGYCNFGSVNPSGTIRVANWGSRLTSD